MATNIETFIKKVGSNKWQSEYKGEPGQINNDISFIHTTSFDRNNRFIVGYGKEKVFVYNFQLKIRNHDTFKIKTFFEEIHAVRLISSSQTLYKCMVACKKKNKKEISIYDIAEHRECGDADKHLDGS